jgi:hypothetical protein
MVMMKFAFRVIFMRPPFSKWLPTKSSNCQWSPISMKIDISEYFEVRNWLVMMKLASIWESFGDFCVCTQTQSNLVIIIILLSFFPWDMNMSKADLRNYCTALW